jgi:hypothetical protein
MPTTFQNKAGCRPPGFYTYAYLRAKDSARGRAGSPYYIGKGEGDRAWGTHGGRSAKWSPPCNDQILILKWGLSEDDAHAHEIYLIALYGNALTDGGILTKNYTDGGEGCKGYQWTHGQRRALSQKQLGRTQDTLLANFAQKLGVDAKTYAALSPVQRKAVRERVQNLGVEPSKALADLGAVGGGPGMARQYYSAKRYGLSLEQVQALSLAELQLINKRYRKGLRGQDLLAPPQPKGVLSEGTEAHLLSKYQISLDEWNALSRKQKQTVAVRYGRGWRGEALWGGLKDGIRLSTWLLARKLEIDPVVFASLPQATKDSLASKHKYSNGRKRGAALLEGLL